MELQKRCFHGIFLDMKKTAFTLFKPTLLCLIIIKVISIVIFHCHSQSFKNNLQCFVWLFFSINLVLFNSRVLIFQKILVSQNFYGEVALCY